MEEDIALARLKKRREALVQIKSTLGAIIEDLEYDIVAREAEVKAENPV